MTYDLKIKLSKIDSLKNRNFNPAETDWLINEAQLVWVKTRAKRAEIGQEARQELSTLLIKAPSKLQPGLAPSVVPDTDNKMYEVSLSDFEHTPLRILRVYARISKKGCTDKIASVSFEQHEDLNDILGNSFRSPSFEWSEVPAVMGAGETDDSIYMYTDGTFEIKYLYPEYIKVPRRVSLGGYKYLDGSTTTEVNSELPEFTHPEIIDLAVSQIFGFIGDPNFKQLADQKVIINEN